MANKKCVVDAEVFRKILDICPRVEGEEFTKIQDDDATLTFLIDLGYKGSLHKHTSMYVDHMPQPWRTLAAIINKCLFGKTRSNDKLRKSRINILWGMFYNENVDYPELIWEDFAFQIDHRKEKKSRRKTTPFPRFTKVIINHFLSQHKSLSKLKFQHYHTIKDDSIINRLKFIRIGEDYQEYGSRSTRGVFIQDTPSDPNLKPAASKLKLKGVQSLTPEEQEAADTMQALKESKKTSRRQSESKHSKDSQLNSDEEEKKDNDGDADDDDEDKDVDHIRAKTVERENKEKDEMTDAAKADVEKTAKEKGDTELARNMQSPSVLKVPISVIPKTTTLPPTPKIPTKTPISTALSPPRVTPTISIVQQTTTPIPTPPITTEASTISTSVFESDALSVVQLRVAKLEKDVSELKKIDHSIETLATLKSQVPTIINNYLGSKLGDSLQKVL
ncbi:hypothetical protein Tco_0537402 [Tanacetum coccineum]